MGALLNPLHLQRPFVLFHHSRCLIVTPTASRAEYQSVYPNRLIVALLPPRLSPVSTSVDLSFPTIAGSDSNGAIIHYSADPGSCHAIGRESMLLLDSGAQVTLPRTQTLQHWKEKRSFDCAD